MRTNIEIDDGLLKDAMDASGHATKRATVETALKLLVQDHRRRKALNDIAGLGWDGDLDALRTSRQTDLMV